MLDELIQPYQKTARFAVWPYGSRLPGDKAGHPDREENVYLGKVREQHGGDNSLLNKMPTYPGHINKVYFKAIGHWGGRT